MNTTSLEQVASLLEAAAPAIRTRWLSGTDQLVAEYQERINSYRQKRSPWITPEQEMTLLFVPFLGRTEGMIEVMSEQVGGELRRREPDEKEMAENFGESIRRCRHSDMNCYLLCMGALHRWTEWYVKSLCYDVLANFSADLAVRDELVGGHWVMLRGEVGRWVTRHGPPIVRSWDPMVVVGIDKTLTTNSMLGIKGLRTVYGCSFEKARDVWMGRDASLFN